MRARIIPDFSLEKSAPSDSEGLQDQTLVEFGRFCRVSQILQLHKIVRSKNPGLPRKIGKSSSDLPNDPFGANFASPACGGQAKFGIILRQIAEIILLGICLLVFVPGIAGAHCDTLDGPVVKDARIALEKGDATGVLKWVKQEHELEIKQAFNQALAERKKGAQAQAKADREFFETLVRIHRAGEGAPFTGLKPAGTDLGPEVVGADKSLETGSVDELVKLVNDAVAEGIRERFNHAVEKKKHVDESVEAGREFVEAYIEFVHYVEKLYLDATGKSVNHHKSEEKDIEGEHHH